MSREQRKAKARELVINLAQGIAALKKDGMTAEQMKKSCMELVPQMAATLRMFAAAMAMAGKTPKGKHVVESGMEEFQAAFPTDEEWDRLLGPEVGAAVVAMFREAIRQAGEM
jgi:hypothetical protein